MGLFSWLTKFKKPFKPKLGLALGSGGAKGFAELGALKAFEENGVEFDIIAGTSIGSIVGAFYADGYSVTDIFELLKRINFGEITNLFMINMDTSGMFKVIDRTIGSLNIEELKKPFKTVATEIETGSEHVFDKGSVATALCASSCIPPFFKPILIDGLRFVDGAFSNAIPADLVKEMGADYIVGIDLANREAKPSLLMRLFPTYKSKVDNPSEKGYQYSDVMLHPNLDDYTAVSFSAGSQMFDIGYQTAMEHMDKILNDIKNLKPKKKTRSKNDRP